MDVSGDVADLMVKESIVLTEESIKLLAAGSKNLAAFLWALSRDSRKLVGKTNMGRLLREGKELRVFRIKEDDLQEFRNYAKKSVLFAVIKDQRSTDGMVDLVTNVDFVSQVNLFMERRGYAAPPKEEADPSKKDGPRAAPQDSSSPQRGNTLTNSLNSSEKPNTATRTTSDGAKPSVKARLAALRAASEGMEHTPHTHSTPHKTR